MNWYVFSLSFTSIFSFVLGIFVIYKNPKNPINLTWGLACFCVGGWSLFFVGSLFLDSQRTATFFVRVLNVFAAYIPVLTSHFSKEITGVNKDKKGLIYFGYFLTGIITVMAFTDYFCTAGTEVPGFRYYTKAGPLYSIFTAQFFFYALYGEYLLIRGLSTATAEKRNQIKYILIGLTSGYFGGFISFMPTYGIKVNLIPMHFIWLYAAIISYAILKHKLMDIEIVFKKTLLYSLFASAISVFYVCAVFVAHRILMGDWSIQTLSFGKINMFAISSILCGIASTCLALFAFIVGRSKAHKIFAFLNVAIALWGIACFIAAIADNQQEATFGWRLSIFSGTFIAPLFYHLVSTLFPPGKKRIIWAGYFQSSVIAAWIIFDPTAFIKSTKFIFEMFYLQASLAITAGIVLYFIYVILSYAHLISFYKTGEGAKRKQAAYFIFAFLFGFVGGGSILLPEFGITAIYPVGNFGICIYAIITAYAIFKHQLMDIKIVIKHTLFYSLFVAVLSVLYVLVIFLFHRFFFNQDTSKPTLFVSVAFILLITILLKPIENFLKIFIDRKFFKGTIGEIAEQKARLETELERRERLKSVGILAAGMAHEIKNPITAIQTFAEYLPKKYDDPEFRENFSRLITLETKRVSEIVRDLLLFAKPTEPKPEICDIYDITKNITDLLRLEFSKYKIEVEMAMKRGECLCFADSSQIKQALVNIIMNAIDAMKQKSGGFLKIASAESGKNIMISIQDSGVGIPQEKIAYLFDPFYTDKEGGTGLGLAVTHSIIEKNRGKIEVQSELGEGTTFRIFLPHA